MKRLALTLVLCGLVISGTEAADQTCKAKATQQELVGEALLSFVKQCETDAYMACAEAAHKMLAEPGSDRFIHTCVAEANPASRQARPSIHARSPDQPCPWHSRL